MLTERKVHLERIDNLQTLRIPIAFELPGNEALIRKEGDCLIIEPVQKSSLLAYLATLEPIQDDFVDVDTDLLALDEIVL